MLGALALGHMLFRMLSAGEHTKVSIQGGGGTWNEPNIHSQVLGDPRSIMLERVPYGCRFGHICKDFTTRNMTRVKKRRIAHYHGLIIVINKMKWGVWVDWVLIDGEIHRMYLLLRMFWRGLGALIWNLWLWLQGDAWGQMMGINIARTYCWGPSQEWAPTCSNCFF